VHLGERGDLPRHPDSAPARGRRRRQIDITAFHDGAHGEPAATFYVGDVAPEVRDLGERTNEALRGPSRGQAGPAGERDRRVIESYAKRFNLRRGGGDYTATASARRPHQADDPCTTTNHAREPRSSGHDVHRSSRCSTWRHRLVDVDHGWTVVTVDQSWVAQGSTPWS